MKKTLFLMFGLVMTLCTTAQVKVGLKGGASFANVKYTSGTSSETFNTIIAPNFGITLDFPGKSAFNIQSGLFYTGMGGKSSVGSFTETVNLNYLSIPVLAKLSIGSGFFGYFGPQLSFLISAKSKDPNGTYDIKKDVNSTGLFGILGLGYNLSEKFNFFGQYSAGFSNLSKSSNSGDKLNANAFTIGFGLSLSK